MPNLPRTVADAPRHDRLARQHRPFATIAAWSLPMSVLLVAEPPQLGRVLLVCAGGSVAIAGLVMLAESDATPAVAGEAIKAGKNAAAAAARDRRQSVV